VARTLEVCSPGCQRTQAAKVGHENAGLVRSADEEPLARAHYLDRDDVK
jgi:hypothetical protein